MLTPIQVCGHGFSLLSVAFTATPVFAHTNLKKRPPPLQDPKSCQNTSAFSGALGVLLGPIALYALVSDTTWLGKQGINRESRKLKIPELRK